MNPKLETLFAKAICPIHSQADVAAMDRWLTDADYDTPHAPGIEVFLCREALRREAEWMRLSPANDGWYSCLRVMPVAGVNGANVWVWNERRGCGMEARLVNHPDWLYWYSIGDGGYDLSDVQFWRPLPAKPTLLVGRKGKRLDGNVVPRSNPANRMVPVLPTDRMDRCHAGRDGECYWAGCPQEREGEPARSGRSCPLYVDSEDE